MRPYSAYELRPRVSRRYKCIAYLLNRQTQRNGNIFKVHADKRAADIHAGMSFHTAYYVYTEFDRSLTVFTEQHNIIKELAERSDCVIVGRCADYILKEKDPFRIFVYADAESKLKRCRERSPEDENLSDSKIQRNIRSIDKGRARYYNYFSRQKWGARENYDLLINTSGKDVKQVSEAVADLVKKYLFD